MPLKLIIRIRTADLNNAGRNGPITMRMNIEGSRFPRGGFVETVKISPKSGYDRAEIDDYSHVIEHLDHAAATDISWITLKGSSGDHFAFEWIDVRIENTDVLSSFLGLAVKNNALEQIWIKSKEVMVKPTEMFEYTIRTKTAASDNAGTNNDIHICFPEALHSLTDSRTHKINDPREKIINDKRLYTFSLNTRHDDFQYGKIDTFTIKSIFPLGPLDHGPDNVTPRMKIELKLKGHDAWKMEWVQVEQVKPSHVWSFLASGKYAEVDDDGTLSFTSTDAVFYDVLIKTGSLEGAGTDSAVELTLHDANGTEHTYILDEPSRDDFERFATDKFRIMSHHIDNLQDVSVKLVKDGSWFVDWVEVRTVGDVKPKVRTYPANQWIKQHKSAIRLHQKPMQFLQVTTKTANANHASSDAVIEVQFVGRRNGRHLSCYGMVLDNKANNFEARNSDTFLVRSNVVFDDIFSVTLKNRGDDWWQVEWVQVDILRDKEVSDSFNFPGLTKRNAPLGAWVKPKNSLTLQKGTMTSFVVGVQTGASGKGGEDVIVDVTDDRGHSIAVSLDHSHVDDLAAGSTGLYRHKSMDTFGTLKTVSVRGMDDGWFVNWLSVYVDNNRTQSTNPFYIYEEVSQPRTFKVHKGNVTASETELLHMAIDNCPQLVHHTDEKYHVSSVESFLARSSVNLYDRHGNEKDYRPDSDFSEFHDHGAGYFFKDTDGSDEIAKRPFNPKTAKVYVNFKGLPNSDFVDIQYWYFYPWNGPGIARLTSVIMDTNMPGAQTLELGNLGEHEGDWEHVTLRVNTKDKGGPKAKAIFLSQHAGGKWLPMDMVHHHHHRPKIYASLNGHAAYTKIDDNPSRHIRKLDRISGFFHFLSPPAIDFKQINETKEGPMFDGCNNIVVIGAHNIPSMVDFKGPNWVNFKGRFGHSSGQYGTDEAHLPADTLRDALTQAILTASLEMPQVYAVAPVLVPAILALETYVMIDPERIAQALLDQYFPASEADGNGPTGPAMKPNWHGSE